MLPQGYLDMSAEDYAALSVPVLREVYVKVRDIVVYTTGAKLADSAAREVCPVTPVEWIEAYKQIVVGCVRCAGSGTYEWGACINGIMSHRGPCNRCAGTGRMTFDDMRRCKAYDSYAICKALR